MRKLEGCEHEVHTACFQNWVNRELATNTDHRGPVSCPNCRKDIPDEKHSMVELFDVVPLPKTIHLAVFLAEMFLNGVGVALLVSSSKASSVYKKVAWGVAGAAVIFGRVVRSAYYVTHYSKNQVVRVHGGGGVTKIFDRVYYGTYGTRRNHRLERTILSVA